MAAPALEESSQRRPHSGPLIEGSAPGRPFDHRLRAYLCAGLHRELIPRDEACVLTCRHRPPPTTLGVRCLLSSDAHGSAYPDIMLVMDLRSELLPPPIGEGPLRAVSAEITRIAELIGAGRRTAADAAITEFNAQTRHSYGLPDFVDFSEWRDLEDFAREAARPGWPKAADVSRAELIEIVRRIQAADPETDYYMLLLRANTPHPHVSDLIFHPSAELGDASAEQIVDAALAYQAIAL